MESTFTFIRQFFSIYLVSPLLIFLQEIDGRKQRKLSTLVDNYFENKAEAGDVWNIVQ